MRRMSAFGLAVLLAACSSEPGTSTDEPANASADGPVETNDMEVAGNLVPGARESDSANPAPPKGGAQAAWTGRFAATPDLCRYGAWHIGRERIVTGGETSCSVSKMEESGRSVVLTLACLADGNAADERWTLTPGPDDALAVKRDTGREVVEVDLRRCA